MLTLLLGCWIEGEDVRGSASRGSLVLTAASYCRDFHSRA
jgi:hypothetical protein